MLGVRHIEKVVMMLSKQFENLKFFLKEALFYIVNNDILKNSSKLVAITPRP